MENILKALLADKLRKSNAETNDKLIDNLKRTTKIFTPSVERVFRLVDRGNYYLERYRSLAYDGNPWMQGNLHMSAPTIYAVVVEKIDIQPGVSFLNIGSGTGYLSTIVGHLIGRHGVNHGIEIHQDVVEYAWRKLEEHLILHAKKENVVDFCKPTFVHGNCFRLNVNERRYDRIYVGAACPDKDSFNFFKQLLHIGGSLVMPYDDKFIRVKRVEELRWTSEGMFAVTFKSLIPQSQEDKKLPRLQMPAISPNSLQDTHCLVRSSVGRDNHGKMQEMNSRTTKMQEKNVCTTKMQEMDSRTTEMHEKEVRTTKIQEMDSRTTKLQEKDVRTTKMQEMDSRTSKMQEKDVLTTKMQEVDLRTNKMQQIELCTTLKDFICFKYRGGMKLKNHTT